jgi:CBS domain containing-hemolysin-like protein
MPDDSDPKTTPASGSSAATVGNDTQGRAPEPAPPAPPPLPLLSDLAARLASAMKGFRRESAIHESLEEVIEESDRETQELSSQERLMLANLLRFGELSIADVMVPRADIVAVEEKTSLAELVAVYREAQHSRLPIYRETLDDPLGMVHVKDVLGLLESSPDGTMRWPAINISKLKRDVLFVPASMPALDLLMRMQATRIHLALVIDEYGGTDGLVSIEDLVEEIVGDIEDEHDIDEQLELVPQTDGSFIADARISLDDFKERTGIDLAFAEIGDDVDTLGGVVVAALGRVPVRGEIVGHGDLEFEILDADPRRVKRLRLRTRQPANAVAAR